MAKVKICPICGGKRIVVVGGKTMCADCRLEVIPLVTPQER